MREDAGSVPNIDGVKDQINDTRRQLAGAKKASEDQLQKLQKSLTGGLKAHFTTILLTGYQRASRHESCATSRARGTLCQYKTIAGRTP